MKINRFLLLALIFGNLMLSCSTDNDDSIDRAVTQDTSNLEVENFVYDGMNEIYLYKANVAVLADNYFATQADKNDFLAGFNSPEDLFYEGLVDESNDRFSFITDNYIELENNFAGISTTTGMNFGLSYYPDDDSKVFGYVRYVEPNTSADEQGVKRGDIFTKIDGEQLTPSNYNQLLASEDFSLGLGTIGETGIEDTDTEIALTKAQYAADPVFIAKTLDLGGRKVAYLMYNSFTEDYDQELNEVFGDFKSQGVTDLVLDLRYNGGGSVRSAVRLSSMITGQFTDKVFLKKQWNEEIQAQEEAYNPERLVDRFTDKIGDSPINSLELEKVYTIGTGSTASASELVINGLKPYIDVVQIGTPTVGKFQASVTLYDSPNFGRENANPNHSYAIQPLVFVSANANGVTAYKDGLLPDFMQQEYIDTYGVLGDPAEPLLAIALQQIGGTETRRALFKNGQIPIQNFSESGVDEIDFQKMYIDKLPTAIKK